MARKRMLDPNIWEDENFGALTISARLLFIGMISHADDEGIGIGSAKVLKRAVFGFDEHMSDEIVEALMQEIVEKMPNVLYYEVEGRQYFFFKNWKRYQRLHSPTPTKYPLPPGLNGKELPPSASDGYANVMTQWSNSVPGMMTSSIADELYRMIEDWNVHVEKLAWEHPDKPIQGYEAVSEA